MKFRTTALICSLTVLLTGCKHVNLNPDSLMKTGSQAFQAATLSDEEVKTLSNESCKQIDSESHIAGAKSVYQKRLNKIAHSLGDNINGTPVNYKVYLTKDVNAWAMANGCIRVYSGLMDMMTDNEIEGVLGHEMGHVALGHTRKAMQVAMATTAAHTGAESAGGVAASLSKSQLANVGEALINAQFSQSQESAADDYSFDLLKKRGINAAGLASSFDKLSKLEGTHQSSMFDSHPPTADRAAHIKARIAAGK